jgi:hypothetical protein
LGDYITPLILLVVLFVGFGLVHRDRQSGVGCSGCTSCADKSECKNKNAEADAAKPQ